MINYPVFVNVYHISFMNKKVIPQSLKRLKNFEAQFSLYEKNWKRSRIFTGKEKSFEGLLYLMALLRKCPKPDRKKLILTSILAINMLHQFDRLMLKFRTRMPDFFYAYFKLRYIHKDFFNSATMIFENELAEK